MFDLLVAARLLLTAPLDKVGIDKGTMQARFGAPQSVSTDYYPSPAAPGLKNDVVTLDWPQLRVRLHVDGGTQAVTLLGVTATADVLKIDSPVHIGVDRGTVLRELGGPLYEDEIQIVYGLSADPTDRTNPTVRIVFKGDRVVGLDWTYPVQR
jgi:hypothetical protein